MTTKQQVLLKAGELGATVREERTDIYEVLIDAPDGKHWFDGGCSQLVWSQWDDESKQNAWPDLLERMEWGLESCDECCGHLEQN
jgi:hypothetical protein